MTRSLRTRYVRSRARLLPALLLAAACGGDSLELAGVVERTTLELSAPVSEEVVELPRAVGEHVGAGEPVVRMGTEVAELEVEAVRALHRAAEANLAAAEQEFQRVEGLRRARVSTPKELDTARRGRDEAVAMLAERAARRAQAERRLADLTVHSSAAGVVDQLPYDVGERVPAGGVVAVVLADEMPWVRVWLPARAVGRLASGAAAQVEIEGYGEPFAGRLREVSREPAFTPHYALTERERAHLVYEARVLVDGAPADLRPGLPATVRLRPDAARGKDG
jgi:HlyD family secretion protein